MSNRPSPDEAGTAATVRANDKNPTAPADIAALDWFTDPAERAITALLIEQADLFHGGRGVSFNEAVKARQEAAERFSALDLDRKREIIRALLRVTVAPSPKGIRPTKATARQRIKVTWLDPMKCEPEEGDELVAETIGGTSSAKTRV